MNTATGGLDTEQVITKPSAVEGGVEQPEANPPSSKQEVRQASPLSSSIIGALIAAFITSTMMVVTNAWIVPTVARHQKRIDRMHQAMFDTAQSAGLLYGYTWRMWRERQIPVGATNKPLEDFQQVEAKAKALAFQLPLIFGTDITTQWNAIVNGYGSPDGMSYKITQPKEFPILPTEEKMNETLNPLAQSAGELVTRMQNMIREVENRPWWRVLFLARNS